MSALFSKKEMRDYQKAAQALAPQRGYNPRRINDDRLATVTPIRPGIFTGTAGI